MKKITIIGIGRWGTLLAWYLKNRGYDIMLWGRNKEKLELLKTSLENKYVHLQKTIKFTNDIGEALTFSNIIFVAILSQGFRNFCDSIKHLTGIQGKTMISTIKGLDCATLMRMSETAHSVLGVENFAVLGGPGHAEEITAGKRTCLVVASRREKIMDMVSGIFYSDTIRIYKVADVTGVELSGAFKNVIGIASGICDGMGELGLKASLISRSMVEIKRLGGALGAKIETFNGLSLVGDFCVTCFGPYSKNRKVGELIASGEKLSAISISAEGIHSTRSFYELGKKCNVEMPICEQIYNILYRHTSVKKALNALWQRPLKKEF